MKRAIGIGLGLILLGLEAAQRWTDPAAYAGRRLAAECGAVWWEDVPPRVSADEVRALLAMPSGVWRKA
jgi:hypothetical protein